MVPVMLHRQLDEALTDLSDKLISTVSMHTELQWCANGTATVTDHNTCHTVEGGVDTDSKYGSKPETTS